jgi:hypothetical protein
MPKRSTWAAGHLRSEELTMRKDFLLSDHSSASTITWISALRQPR